MTTLYQRLGGDPAVKLAISVFFEEIMDEPDLRPFFENISISALEAHQLKLFRVIFGPKEEQPDPDEFLGFMLATHTRLFRECGLDETHFDLVAECFVRAMNEMQADPEIIDECLAILGPLRVVFEYGAKIATKEKTLSPAQLTMLPTTTAKNVQGERATRLPDPASIDIPLWLPETLEQHSKNGVVRAWTRYLTDRFGADGDTVIADTFMDMPYMNHHVYLAAFLQLAFLPEGADSSHLLPVVQYPRGPDKRKLCRGLWERMVGEFQKACVHFGMEESVANEAVERLKRFNFAFRKTDGIKLVGGLSAPHVLWQKPNPNFHVEVNGAMEKQEKEDHSEGSSGNYSADDTLSMASSLSHSLSYSKKMKKPKKKGVWRRLLGWTTVH